MENIDPIYFLTPVIVIAFSSGIMVYWLKRRRLTVFVLLFSLVAYSGAILAKYSLQALTYGSYRAAVGGNLFALGAYFGLQTVVFEIGGAYLIARYAVSHGMFRGKDAEGYGISLGFWENGVLIGGSLLLDYTAYYATLASSSGTTAQQLFSVLSQSSPALFYPPSSALPLIGYAVLERVSSLLLHFSWGYLCVFSVVFRKPSFLMLALPMGLVDFLTPFAGSLGTATFEGLIFAIALVGVAGALTLTRGGSSRREGMLIAGPNAEEAVSARLGSIFSTNFKRAFSFGRLYLVMGMGLPLLFTFEIAAGGGSTAGSSILEQTYPLTMPIFVVIGSVGGLMIFSSDKDKGVYEYLIAYGVDTATIFWSIIVATAGIVTIVLAVSLAVSIVSLVVTGNVVTVAFGELVLFYTIPLSYAATMFMSMAGMIWSSLTSRIAGVNSPVGVAPILGIAPILAVLFLAFRVGSAEVLYLVGGVSIVMIWAVVGMAYLAGSKMQRERFLSNA